LETFDEVDEEVKQALKKAGAEDHELTVVKCPTYTRAKTKRRKRQGVCEAGAKHKTALSLKTDLYTDNTDTSQQALCSICGVITKVGQGGIMRISTASTTASTTGKSKLGGHGLVVDVPLVLVALDDEYYRRFYDNHAERMKSQRIHLFTKACVSHVRAGRQKMIVRPRYTHAATEHRAYSDSDPDGSCMQIIAPEQVRVLHYRRLERQLNASAGCSIRSDVRHTVVDDTSQSALWRALREEHLSSTGLPEWAHFVLQTVPPS
jgi:hypothetical protein